MIEITPIADFPSDVRARFLAIRKLRVAKYCISDNDLDKICHDAHEKQILRELLIRAHFDPDFRFELIWNTKEALAQIPGGHSAALMNIHFRYELSNKAQEIKFDALENCIYLMPPVWHNIFNRERLKVMIDAKR